MADLDPLSANASIARYLEAGAQPASSDWSRSDARLDGWELRCHPDLVERLTQAAAELPVELVYVRGLPVLVHPNGVAFATAAGTSQLLLRLPREMRDGVEAGRWGSGDLGEDEWVGVEPWLDRPGDGPVLALAEWLRRAFDYAGSLPTE